MRLPIPIRRGRRLLAGPQFSINFTTTVHLRGPLTLERLDNALARLCRRHPLLGAHVVVENDETAWLTEEGSLPVPVRIVERESDETWIREVQRELPGVFNYRTGPLYRCAWVRGKDDAHDLVFVTDHSSADGRAAMVALRDLMSFLADPALDLDPVLPPHMGDLVPTDIAQKVAEMVAPPDAPPPPPWSPKFAADPQRIIPILLDEAETAALARRCKAEGVSVQSALCAAFLTPFAERQPDAPLRRAEVPVDLRPFLDAPVGDAYGLYNGLTTIEVDCRAGQTLWDAARSAQKGLRAISGRDMFLVPPAIYMIAKGPIFGKFITHDYDLSVSNLGRIELPSAGSLRVEAVHAPTFNVQIEGHRVLGVCTCNGRLAATYTSCDPAAPALKERGMELLRGMMRD